IIKRGWFRFYDVLPPYVSGQMIVQSWDVAMATGNSHDYSVCTTWIKINNNYYLIDVFRERLEYPYLRQKVVSLAANFGADTILIEEAGPGMSLLQDLRSDPL